MRLTKRCEKCGGVTEVDVSDESAACGGCGAIFAKVHAARSPKPADSGPNTAAPSQFKPSTQRLAERAKGDKPFLAELRAGTNYPTFRAFVNFFYWFWIVLAVLSAGSGLLALVRSDGAGFAPIAGLVLAVFFVFIGRLLREVSMMLADIGDATIRTAQREG